MTDRLKTTDGTSVKGSTSYEKHQTQKKEHDPLLMPYHDMVQNHTQILQGHVKGQVIFSSIFSPNLPMLLISLYKRRWRNTFEQTAAAVKLDEFKPLTIESHHDVYQYIACTQLFANQRLKMRKAILYIHHGLSGL